MAMKVPEQPSLRLTLFGGPALARGRERIITSPFQGALLGLLATHGRRGVRRERVMALFWRDGTDAQLRRRISQLVYSIHRRTGERSLIRLEGEHYLLEMERVESDLERFLLALRDRELATALTIAGRGFLSGIAQVPTPELEEWIGERDLRFRSDVRTLAAERWSEAEQRADWAMAEEAAETLLELDTEDETVLRQLLRAAALNGSPEEAEIRFRRFRELRRLEDPRWEAEAETVELLGRLDEIASRREEYVTVHAHSHLVDPPLVGRNEELLQLTHTIRHPPQEGVRVVVVTGEAGIGKTRLVREALQRAPFDGVRVLSGKCSEFERNIPLSPIVRCLSPDWVRRELGSLSEPWRSVVASVCPEAWTEGASSDGTGPHALHEIPRVLCEALFRLFTRLAGQEALVLFLDDFQWIDATSLSVLEYVRNSWEEGGLVLVVAVRPEDLQAGSWEERWLDTVDDPVLTARLNLGPLRPEEASTLIRQALTAWTEGEGPGDLPEDGVARMGELVGGHPLLALECIRGYARRSGELAPRASDVPVPDVLRRMILKRRDRLSPSARTLLECLSLSEKATPLSVLEQVHGAPPTELSAHLDEVIGEQFADISPRGVELRHGLFREVVYRNLSHGRRALLHQRTAETLAALDDRSLATDVAMHLFAAGEPRRAIPYVLDAARTATTHGGWSEARSLLEMALEGDPSVEERAALTSALGSVVVLEGDFHRAENVWTEAAAAFDRLENEEESLLCSFRALEARSLAPSANQEALLLEVEGLRAQAEDRELPRVVGECMVLQIRILDALRRIDDVRRLTAEARKLANSQEGGSDLPFLLVSVIDALYGNPEAAVETADRAVAAASKGENPDLALRALNWKIIAYYQQAQLQSPSAKAAIKEARKLARSSRDLQQRFHLEKNLGCWNMEVGDYAGAERAFERSQRILEQFSSPRLRRLLFLNRAQLALECSRFQEAIAHFTESLETPNAISHASFQYVALSGLGLAFLSQGVIHQAREIRSQIPPHTDEWTADPFDPFLWIRFNAQSLVSIDRRPNTACDFLIRQEASLHKKALPTWMRVRMLRLDLATQNGIGIPQKDIQELKAFLSDREITQRLEECTKILGRVAED